MIIPIQHKRLGTHLMHIDDEDYDKIKHLNLTLNHTSNKNTYYCKSIIYHKCKYVKKLHIHRVIMGLGDYKDDKRIIHHIDGNGLNNHKSNLEICNIMYNSQSIRRIGNVGYINYDTSMTRLKRWRFQIKVMGKRHSKRFLTKEEAEKYRDNYILSI